MIGWEIVAGIYLAVIAVVGLVRLCRNEMDAVGALALLCWPVLVPIGLGFFALAWLVSNPLIGGRHELDHSTSGERLG